MDIGPHDPARPWDGAGRPSYPPARSASYALVLLMAAAFTSCLDRYLVGVLGDPIKREIGLSDVQLSLIQGSAFAVVYAICGLPLGWMVDRYNRRNIVMAGLVCWTASTMAFGLASGFGGLFAGRLGVGMAEACLAPAAYSLIAGYFPPERQGWAIANFTAALTVGSGASFLLGSAVFDLFGNTGLPDFFFVSGLSAWRLTFLVLALPGFLIALLFSTLREPPRFHAIGTEQAAGLERLGAFLKRRRAALVGVTLASACYTMLATGTAMWTASIIHRSHPEASLSWIGLRIGIIMIGGSVVSAAIAGNLADSRWADRQRGGRLSLIMWANIVALPFAIAWPQASSPQLAVALYAGWMVLSFIAGCAAPAALQAIVPDHLKGQVAVMYWLVVGLAGIGLGPTLIALVGKHLIGDEARLGLALVATVAALTLAICLIVLLAAPAYDAARSRRSDG